MAAMGPVFAGSGGYGGQALLLVSSHGHDLKASKSPDVDELAMFQRMYVTSQKASLALIERVNALVFSRLTFIPRRGA